MIKTIHPSSATGNITSPPSKSMTQRAIAAGLMADGSTTILNPSFCNDALAAIDIARKLGADIIQDSGQINIKGGLPMSNNMLNCGESGLAMRMFAPIAALRDSRITFNGSGSLFRRPIHMIGEALMQFGVQFESSSGFLPFSLKGPMIGSKAVIDGSVSSQLLTGLLMALPLCRINSEIQVNNLKSKPYVSMTLEVLEEFGISIGNKGYEIFHIPGNQKYMAHEYTVEGDWSGGAFLLAAAAINGNIKVHGLNRGSCQADLAILEALRISGVNLVINDDSIAVSQTRLNAFDFDASDCPDLFLPMAALAAYCIGTSKIAGVGRLIFKESNRAEAIREEMGKLGIQINIQGDVMHINGGKVRGATVNSHHDHRIAMMTAITALGSDAPVTIENAECVAKSYPEFFHDLSRLGVLVE